MDRMAAESAGGDRSKRSTSRQKKTHSLTEKEKKLAAIPKGTVDEDRIMYWLWGKVNPAYMKYVSKHQVLDFFEVNPEILQAFGFHPKEYRRVVLSMITERHDMLTFDEFDVGCSHKGTPERGPEMDILDGAR